MADEVKWQVKLKDVRMRVLVLNGPNLNLLGSREPDIYGRLTLDEINDDLRVKFPGVDFEFYQSNHEGDLIDKLQSDKFDGAVFNPGAFTHYSYALYDCIRAMDYPVVEVHLSDINSREDFRKVSVIAPACLKSIMGLGAKGYHFGVEVLMETGDKTEDR